jgi:5'-3' exonuclease
VSKCWLVIDAPNLCWRMFHVMGQLRFGGEQTGVAYGALREWLRLFRSTDSTGTVWCFDRGAPERAKVYPGYKARRKVRTEDEKVARSACGEQIDRLEVDLPRLGFSNVFGQDGYEADDLIASVVGDLPEGDEAFVLSSDKDLWQLLAPNVRIIAGKETLTLQKFTERYGIAPHRWADVKALSGCDSDDVEGVRGVGELTAVRYLKRELNPESAAFRKIREGRLTWERNLDLVSLPFPGTRLFNVRDDRLDSDRWDEYCKRRGFKTLNGVLAKRGERRLF